jgi:hypothetical protein
MFCFAPLVALVFAEARIRLKIRIYKSRNFPEVLYGCETRSLTLKEEHRLRVFENRVLRRIFETKRDAVIGG